MRFVRQQVTGPSQNEVTVLVVTTAGFHFDLTSIYYRNLLQQIQDQKPLLMTADTNPVYYLWTSETSGLSVDPAQGATGGGANGVPSMLPAVVYAASNPERLETPTRDTVGLVVKSTGGTATLRIWSGGA